MLKTNQYNVLAGVGQKLALFKEKVYKLSPNILNQFVDENYRCLAKRVTLPLVQDRTYKTSFFNEMLAFAIQPLNEYTQFILYNEDGQVVNTYPYLPKLVEDYASIVCQYEPEKPFTEISIVIYCGPEVNQILLSDGSVSMDSSYRPVNSKDIVTKEYADTLIENFTALSYPLKDFRIDQSGFSPISGYCYKDNALYKNVLFSRDYTTEQRLDDCLLYVSGFAIPSFYVKEKVQIGLFVNGTVTHSAFITDILKNENPYWSLLDTENVYTSEVDSFYWKNYYRLRFNLASFASKSSTENPFLSIAIKIWDNEGHSNSSETITFGIEEYVKSAKPKITINFIEENFDKYRTKWISGRRYFDTDSTRIYELPITVSIENNFLYRFRSTDTNLKWSMQTSKGEILWERDIAIGSHQPMKGSFEIDQKVDFSIDYNVLVFQAFNVKGEQVYEYKYVFDTASDSSDESNRVSTPSGKIQFPASDYGKVWESEKPLNTWDMILQNNVYTSQVNDSAVCFIVKNKDCYSHINIDIEHDGKMYVLSEGNTEWLDCQKAINIFKTPVSSGAGCKLNEGFFTFGKVNYTGPVFIRIIEASKVIFKSANLG